MIKIICNKQNKVQQLIELTKLFEVYIKIEAIISVTYKDTEVELIFKTQDAYVNRIVDVRFLKPEIYMILSNYTSQTLPWGVLTGVRPNKLVHKFLHQNLSDSLIRSILTNEYFIAADKVELLLEVTKAQQKILAQNKPNEISIYIGIPFCPSRCIYCSFPAFVLAQKVHKIDDYLLALEKEIKGVAKDKLIRSLYIGGGTPTSLSELQFRKLMTIVAENFDLSKIEEYTVEAGRPDTITADKLQAMKQYGVSRISINPQSMNQKTLDLIGRSHKVSEIYDVYNMAIRLGFDNINMDMIIGLPEETVGDVEFTLTELAKMSPTNITVHTMAIKTASSLNQQKHRYNLAQSAVIRDMLDCTSSHMYQMGLKPYYMYRQKNILGNFENIGYTKDGYNCIYNVEVMEEQQTILALGAGGASKFINGLSIERFINVKGIEEYIARIDEMIDKKNTIFAFENVKN
ncbi:MAG: coproporphyrinogen dehydrogenase HemZ [Epulopiscium sp. Nuni2H_MBin001]|nr:MAG: coproporphyrinogen dehydrogenase HemZ [Epulopiscium sp. Nuni2H_MBin001]